MFYLFILTNNNKEWRMNMNNKQRFKDVVKKGYLSLFPAQMKTRADEIIETISKKTSRQKIKLCAQYQLISGF